MASPEAGSGGDRDGTRGAEGTPIRSPSAASMSSTASGSGGYTPKGRRARRRSRAGDSAAHGGWQHSPPMQKQRRGSGSSNRSGARPATEDVVHHFADENDDAASRASRTSHTETAPQAGGAPQDDPVRPTSGDAAAQPTVMAPTAETAAGEAAASLPTVITPKPEPAGTGAGAGAHLAEADAGEAHASATAVAPMPSEGSVGVLDSVTSLGSAGGIAVSGVSSGRGGDAAEDRDGRDVGADGGVIVAAAAVAANAAGSATHGGGRVPSATATVSPVYHTDLGPNQEALVPPEERGTAMEIAARASGSRTGSGRSGPPDPRGPWAPDAPAYVKRAAAAGHVYGRAPPRVGGFAPPPASGGHTGDVGAAHSAAAAALRDRTDSDAMSVTGESMSVASHGAGQSLATSSYMATAGGSPPKQEPRYAIASIREMTSTRKMGSPPQGEGSPLARSPGHSRPVSAGSGSAVSGSRPGSGRFRVAPSSGGAGPLAAMYSDAAAATGGIDSRAASVSTGVAEDRGLGTGSPTHWDPEAEGFPLAVTRPAYEERPLSAGSQRSTLTAERRRAVQAAEAEARARTAAKAGSTPVAGYLPRLLPGAAATIDAAPPAALPSNMWPGVTPGSRTPRSATVQYQTQQHVVATVGVGSGHYLATGDLEAHSRRPRSPGLLVPGQVVQQAPESMHRAAVAAPQLGSHEYSLYTAPNPGAGYGYQGQPDPSSGAYANVHPNALRLPDDARRAGAATAAALKLSREHEELMRAYRKPERPAPAPGHGHGAAVLAYATPAAPAPGPGAGPGSPDGRGGGAGPMPVGPGLQWARDAADEQTASRVQEYYSALTTRPSPPKHRRSQEVVKPEKMSTQSIRDLLRMHAHASKKGPSLLGNVVWRAMKLKGLNKHPKLPLHESEAPARKRAPAEVADRPVIVSRGRGKVTPQTSPVRPASRGRSRSPTRR